MQGHDHFRSMEAAQVEVTLMREIAARPRREDALSEVLGLSVRRIQSAAERLIEDGLVFRNPKSRALRLVDPNG